MSNRFEEAIDTVRKWCGIHGIDVHERPMPAGKAGEFNGLSVVMNSTYDPEQRLYYMVHAVGSMVRWSLSRDRVQRMFDELRDAKPQKATQPDRFASAIAQYRAFEKESSQFAVWLLAECRFAGMIDSYSNFMRADLEAMTELHRTGRAPVWRSFFQTWDEEVAAGRRTVVPFPPKPIPPFEPVKTEKQEILQRQPGD